MRSSLIRWLVPVGLAAATLLGSATPSSAQPDVRDHRRSPPAQVQPPQAPPPPRAERQGNPRRGYVWVAGSWNWKNGRYQWVRGRYERVRMGKRWREPTWEQRDGAWLRIEGTWDDAPQYPDQAPPEPRAERVGNRRGFTWIKGRWDWQNGQWVWMNGRFERERAGSPWDDGRWEQRDGRWQWSDGGWREPGSDRPASWSFDSRGWTLLGEKTVDGRTDSDQVDFSQKQGKVSKLTILVLDSDLEMISMKIVYVSGNSETPTDRHYFREGSRTRVLKLNKDDILRAVQFKYRNLPGGGRARVQVWGDVK